MTFISLVDYFIPSQKLKLHFHIIRLKTCLKVKIKCLQVSGKKDNSKIDIEKTFLKGTVSVISSGPPRNDDNVRLTTDSK